MLAFCISARRYTTYERDGKKIVIVDPKAHGLGYLYPPAESPTDADQDIDMWVYEAWERLVRRGCGILPNRPPFWFKYPQNDAYGRYLVRPAEAYASVEAVAPV